MKMDGLDLLCAARGGFVGLTRQRLFRAKERCASNQTSGEPDFF